MIPVTLADIFINPQRGEAWMVLVDSTQRRGLPIFIGSFLLAAKRAANRLEDQADIKFLTHRSFAIIPRCFPRCLN